MSTAAVLEFPGVRAANEKTCPNCSKTHESWSRLCYLCSYRALPDDLRKARNREKQIIRNRRIRENGDTRVSQKEKKLIRQSGPCVYCGGKATETDHVWSLSLSGPDSLSNLVPCCGTCNRQKGSRPLVEFDWEKVIHGLMHSDAVARELARLSAEMPDPLTF